MLMMTEEHSYSPLAIIIAHYSPLAIVVHSQWQSYIPRAGIIRYICI